MNDVPQWLTNCVLRALHHLSNSLLAWINMQNGGGGSARDTRDHKGLRQNPSISSGLKSE
jgi:hypothetical protein